MAARRRGKGGRFTKSRKGPKKRRIPKTSHSAGELGLLQKINKKVTRIELAVNPSRALKAKARKARRAALAQADYSAYERED